MVCFILGRDYRIIKCSICGESDESKLIMSSRLVNSRVRHSYICFRCFWLEKFKAEGEDESAILSEGETIERGVPNNSFFP